ncbi:4Fe-4S binding protein [Persicitalea jodogahamensis]|uniref:4Fe-4S ferredoxin-type domain-containing protein n=1 Tax=Persicitalea jodogahamensis TaxID=402147 RepID=A0A8J3GC13_9BACT|nr:4Fe-4S binding protein [Persicitalea jodogahamensis]GHB85657.1 hypothetical protein GCM10007390_46380 [Persicitalea jodogahamensis]
MPSTYFQNIADGIRTTAKGMSLTWRHLWAARHRRRAGDVRRDDFFDQSEGMVTIQYPLETIPIPDNGRYRLHNEMDDCIVCDKCAKVCPVDCIDIEPIRATEEVGKASDGSPIRLYAAKFDIDMAKCCYCGLCTTVCPTECLTMTKTFDYSELDIRDMVYEFGNLTPAEADEKKRLLEIFQAEKEALKAAAKSTPKVESGDKPAAPRPAFRPSPQMKPKTAAPAEPEVTREEGDELEKSKVPFRPARPAPVMKRPVIPAKKEKPVSAAESVPEEKQTEPPKPKPRAPFRPTMKPPGSTAKAEVSNKEGKVEEELSKEKPKVPFRPTMKPPKAAPSSETAPSASEPAPEKPKPKVPFRPTMKPPGSTAKAEVSNKEGEIKEELSKEKPKVPFRPTMKPPKAAPSSETDPSASEPAPEKPKPKVPFRPTMKPPKPKDE